MKLVLFALACVLSLQTFAQGRTFEERVRVAKQIETTPDGKTYQNVLWKQVGENTNKAMQHCFPKSAHPDTELFTLVGDVGKDARLHGVEVRPGTSMSRCFAERFSRALFPKIPAAFSKTGMPLEIDMKVTP